MNRHGIACQDPECKVWDHVKKTPFHSEAHILDHIAVRTPGGYRETTRGERMDWFRGVMDALTWCGQITIPLAELNEYARDRWKMWSLEEENKNLRAQIIKLKQECKKNS